MKHRSLLLAIVFAAACGGSSRQTDTVAADTSAAPPPVPTTNIDTQPKMPTVTIATDRRSYRAGDPVELRIVNETANSYSYNPCMRIVERAAEGDRWSEVKEDRICAMIAHMLEPNARRTERTELGEQLLPGTYRIVVRFTPDAAGGRVKPVNASSAPITVTP
jgi:hypothetical protein